MLRRLGYTVTSKNNPMEALEVFRANPTIFDIIITDMAMPLMMGYELAAELRKVRLDIPIVYSTGNPELIKEIPNAGSDFNGYLYKPVTYGKLAHTVRNTIDQTDGMES
jgi:CheY-like chemotaxis protein